MPTPIIPGTGRQGFQEQLLGGLTQNLEVQSQRRDVQNNRIADVLVMQAQQQMQEQAGMRAREQQAKIDAQAEVKAFEAKLDFAERLGTSKIAEGANREFTMPDGNPAKGLKMINELRKFGAINAAQGKPMPDLGKITFGGAPVRAPMFSNEFPGLSAAPPFGAAPIPEGFGMGRQPQTGPMDTREILEQLTDPSGRRAELRMRQSEMNRQLQNEAEVERLLKQGVKRTDPLLQAALFRVTRQLPPDDIEELQRRLLMLETEREIRAGKRDVSAEAVQQAGTALGKVGIDVTKEFTGDLDATEADLKKILSVLPTAIATLQQDPIIGPQARKAIENAIVPLLNRARERLNEEGGRLTLFGIQLWRREPFDEKDVEALISGIERQTLSPLAPVGGGARPLVSPVVPPGSQSLPPSFGFGAPPQR